MTTAATATTDETRAEAEIRELVDGWSKAVRALDVDAIMAHYAPEMVAYDAIAALRFRGAEAYRAHWAMCLSMCPGPMIFEVADMSVAAAGAVAFAYGLTRCGGAGENGEEPDSGMRITACYRRRAGRWKIVHEHFSAT